MNDVVESLAAFCGYGSDEIAAGLNELSLYEPVATAG